MSLILSERMQRIFLTISSGLLLFSLLGALFTFGPVVQAEASYQLHSLRKSMGVPDNFSFIPQFDFVMEPEKEISSYGIEIPKIHVSENVVANVDPTDEQAYNTALKKGIAHAAGTGLPGERQQGYYFAHSADVSVRPSSLNAVFYLLGKLEQGDVVYLWREGERYEYRVSEKRVVEATDLSFLNPSATTESIALQTCWPLGTSLKRLVVMAERVE